MNNLDIDTIEWDKMDGLVPATVQDASTGRVLMTGYMNRESLAETMSTGKVTFYSRSRRALWTKGETSGHYLDLVDVAIDCDNDSLLVLANPHGPTCHRGTTSCYGDARPAVSFLGELDQLVASRKRDAPDGSYTAKLFDSGIRRIAQKVGEEGVEAALAGVVQDDDALLGESADLIYHLLVLLRARDLSLNDVAALLRERHGVSSATR